MINMLSDESTGLCIRSGPIPMFFLQVATKGIPTIITLWKAAHYWHQLLLYEGSTYGKERLSSFISTPRRLMLREEIAASLCMNKRTHAPREGCASLTSASHAAQPFPSKEVGFRAHMSIHLCSGSLSFILREADLYAVMAASFIFSNPSRSWFSLLEVVALLVSLSPLITLCEGKPIPVALHLTRGTSWINISSISLRQSRSLLWSTSELCRRPALSKGRNWPFL